MRLGALVGVVRPVGPVVVGISLGFTLSLLSVSWIEEPCSPTAAVHQSLGLLQDASLGARRPNSISTGPDGRGNEDFQPRIIPYKPAKKSQPRKVSRAKYISTELGIRERLFVGVLTSKSSINTLGVAVNRTISQHLDSVLFFTGARDRKVPHGMFVVTHGDERHVWNMYQTVKYILKHFVSEYDWFYLAQDDTYTQAERLKVLVGHLSMNRALYLGRPQELTGKEGHGRYCHGGSGYLLSRTLLVQLQPVLENCRNDLISARPDEWLGRCIVDYTGTNCVEQHEGLRYSHYELGKNSETSKEESSLFRNALTVHPVSDPEHMYRLHKHFTQIQLQRTYEEIEKLQAEIKNVSELAFDGNSTVTWPIGINPPFEPKSRFDVLRWDYFTELQLHSCADGSPQCELHGLDRLDVADAIETAVGELNRKYKPVLHLRKHQLLNGYRRFDPTRGMEYTLDLQLEAVNQRGQSCSIAKRVHLLRPLSHVEIIPMPYVTEATRVHIVLPVTSQEREQVSQFLEVYARNAFMTGENAVLTFLFVYEPFEAQRVNQDDIFAVVKAQIGDYERKYPMVKIPWVSIKTESLSLLKFVDIISKKHPMDTLFFVATVKTSIESEVLNRCRMNAISNWQVFFPVHFQDYNPAVTHHDVPLPKTPDLDKNAGHFDRDSFGEACFYNSDYVAARTRLAPAVQENEDLLESLDLYDLFVKYSGLHVFRAVEPSLRQRYSADSCNPRLSEEAYRRCQQSLALSLGSRASLAMLLFEQEQGHST
ncbi:chondroitin sulfate synthase 2 [Electrophorus electricus]|uniref:Hexosyltransferase n=1 Tax=Electrophorus electricus TaxID=8005 RepID=A0A4W4EJL1_ELEEL|nr:chondroitin sulfate synthase 2 [Electrophorus electricus]